jgi:hypothetical protein
MTRVDREYGFIEDAEGDPTVYTVTVEGSHTADQDQLDRILQFVLVELGVDTSWQIAPPDPTPEELPPPQVPPLPDVPPENQPTGQI